MKKSRVIILFILLIIFSVGLRKLDINLRYNMGLRDYYNYNTDFTEDERELLADKHFIVGVYDDPPLAYINKFNNYNSGIMVDYLSQLAIELSSDILLKVGSKEYLRDEIVRDELDMMVMENTSDNRESFLLTQPLCVVKGRILVRTNSSYTGIEDIKGATLVMLEKDNGGQIHSYFENRTDINILRVDNIYQCFALMNKKIVDGIIGDDMEIAHFLNVTNRGSGYRFLKPIIYEKEICLAVKNNDRDILNILNKGIVQLKKKNLIVQTQYKWLGNFDTDGFDLKNLEIAYKIIIAVLAIIVAFSSWNYLITQRVNTRTRELYESKAELRLIIDTMHNGIMVIENDTIIVECNDAMENITGIEREELIGADYNSFEGLEPFVNGDNMNQVYNIGKSYYYITSQILTNTKSMIVIEDYTEKYFKEKRARQESKMIAVGQLSAGLAHEIRNPLGLIKSYGYVIEKHSINEICDHAIFVINDSVARINKLIENLLRFSKLSNDETKPININNLLRLILELEEKNLRENAIKVSSRVEGIDPSNVMINADVLRMLLLNLINNSIDSYKEIDRLEKRIWIKICVREEQIEIEFEDNGCGIETERLESIFDPFYSTKENGTGLGLYILSTEINNNDGMITVDSSYGEGTRFNIVLPTKEKRGNSDDRKEGVQGTNC